MEQTWKSIPNFSLYEASNDGFIRSINYKKTGRKQILKPALNKSGYLRTVLLNDKKEYKSILIHRLVAMTFIVNINNKSQINHINGIKTDNRIENIEWCTHQENIRHATINKMQKPRLGSLNGNSKLTEKEVKEIRDYKELKGFHYNRKLLANKYNVSECCIKEIITRRKGLWRHV